MKKLFTKVDEKGYFVADELITDLAQLLIPNPENVLEVKDSVGNVVVEAITLEPIQNPLYVDPEVNPIPSGLHLPKWDFVNTWSEGKVIDLEELRNAKFTELENAREAMIYDKFEFEGNYFACDDSARKDINDVEKAYYYSVQKQKEHEEAMALLSEEDSTELPEEYKFEGRWWYVYGGQSVVYIPKDKILDFCIKPSHLKDEAWNKFALLNNQRITADTKEKIEAIVWTNGE